MYYYTRKKILLYLKTIEYYLKYIIKILSKGLLSVENNLLGWTGETSTIEFWGKLHLQMTET